MSTEQTGYVWKREPINSELFRKVADYIERFPDRHDQRQWYVASDGFRYATVDADDLPYHEDPIDNCDTAACVAGTMVLLTPMDSRPVGSVRYAAAKLAYLTREERDFLFDSAFEPSEGLTMAEQLRVYADRGWVLPHNTKPEDDR